MKVADLLRKLADVIAAAESETAPEQPTGTELVQVEVPNDDESEPGVFVPPLQAKLELLKKSVDVPNVYDREGEGEADELADIKKNAGITTAQHIASEDNDITG